MTNKEAQVTINAIKFMLDNAQYSEDVEEALNMAINALTAQSEETHDKRAETHGVCLDAISRQAAISLPVKPKEDRYFQTQNLDDAYDYGWRDLQRCIEKLPPAQPDISEYSDKLWRNAYERGKRDAQPERPKGKWILVKEYVKIAAYKCSECGRNVWDDTGYSVMKDYPFCHCGAEMIGVEDGQ